MVRPSALAVLRLMVSSNLTRCSTAVSAGRLPAEVSAIDNAAISNAYPVRKLHPFPQRHKRHKTKKRRAAALSSMVNER